MSTTGLAVAALRKVIVITCRRNQTNGSGCGDAGEALIALRTTLLSFRVIDAIVSVTTHGVIVRSRRNMTENVCWSFSAGSSPSGYGFARSP